MTMSNEDILSVGTARTGKVFRTAFRGAEARGPIIDQEGREIPTESLDPQLHGFRFDFGNANTNLFGNLTREQRLARLDALAKLLDVAFILPGTNIRYGIDGLIGLIPVVGDIITTAARMLGNVALDGVVGMVPLAGDAFDVMFRANVRNVRLLRRWMDKQPR